MSICECVNRTIDVDLRLVLDGSSFLADWHHYMQFLGRLASLSCVQYIIQVYLKNNTIRIIFTRIYNFFQSLNVIDTFIIVFIHSWLVSMVTHQMKEKGICYIMIFGCCGLFLQP